MRNTSPKKKPVTFNHHYVVLKLWKENINFKDLLTIDFYIIDIMGTESFKLQNGNKKTHHEHIIKCLNGTCVLHIITWRASWTTKLASNMKIRCQHHSLLHVSRPNINGAIFD